MSKKVCIIHTETTGLHELRDEKVYKKNLYGFARMVSFSWIIATRDNDDKFTIIKKQKFIIKPRCLQIPDEIVQFHGISQEIAEKKGTEIEEVLDLFKTDLVGVSVIVSHSLDFHLKTVQAELVRYNKAMNFNKYILIDLNSFEHNIIPTTLQNLCQKLINKDLKDKVLVTDYICELFFKLYNEYENKINPDEIKTNKDEIKTNKDEIKTNKDEIKTNKDEIKTKNKKIKPDEDEIKTKNKKIKPDEDEIKPKDKKIKEKKTKDKKIIEQ